MVHFAALTQRNKGFCHLIRIHQRIGAMNQQQIQIVGVEVAQ